MSQAEWEKRIRRLEEALGKKLLITPGLGDGYQVSTPSGEGLTSGEETLIRLILSEWERSENSDRQMECQPPLAAMARWLQQSDFHQGSSPPPPTVDQLTWEERVPFSVVRSGVYDEPESGLKQVLATYFDQQAWLVPINRAELLVLVPLSLIAGAAGAIEGSQSMEEAAWGLAEVVTTEVGEDVTVVVHPPVRSAEGLPKVLESLREAYYLGGTYDPGQPVYTTWQFTLEKLLEPVDQKRLDRFLAELSPVPFWEDEELCRTLAVFFQQNLNISETARKLFIHRNTLIYRLDRLKQDTGLDARCFEDAFRIRLALLLTKGRAEG
ncbi:MAG: helix-turn-helix domain-containing protein [Firmicutes bacterium]|uniref:PucR C-terminal helix-turn-helix domain-containing protein n=1 Tax=Melghirimyces thermohalophilus TaxID=1236220 RepID=A0A1G6I1N8_9BACL|nr:helix-turn-helix domain-containing protein [Melghirimyces thermohalophilus]MDA8352180.1 helix-turn-helix domain-containing protein [Bacillota bacterium]SDC00384.1 PucR C-terminal helix-turn-helix domain-containing protein [Melghirimyces thermohalophilus]